MTGDEMADAMERQERTRRETRRCENNRHRWPLIGRCQACRAQRAEDALDRAVRDACAATLPEEMLETLWRFDAEVERRKAIYLTPTSGEEPR